MLDHDGENFRLFDRFVRCQLVITVGIVLLEEVLGGDKVLQSETIGPDTVVLAADQTEGRPGHFRDLVPVQTPVLVDVVVLEHADFLLFILWWGVQLGLYCQRLCRCQQTKGEQNNGSLHLDELVSPTEK